MGCYAVGMAHIQVKVVLQLVRNQFARSLACWNFEILRTEGNTHLLRSLLLHVSTSISKKHVQLLACGLGKSIEQAAMRCLMGFPRCSFMLITHSG